MLLECEVKESRCLRCRCSWEAESPDEGALVEACLCCGVLVKDQAIPQSIVLLFENFAGILSFTMVLQKIPESLWAGHT